MSMSMRALANRRALNKEVQINTRLTVFTSPIIQSGDVNVTRNLNVDGNTKLNTLDVDGATKLNTLDVSGATKLNTLDVSGATKLNTLDVSGATTLNTLDISGNILTALDNGSNELATLGVSGNLFTEGYILSTEHLPGQIIRTTMLGSASLTQSNPDISANTDNVIILNYSYTPQSSNYIVLVEYQTDYTVDSLNSNIQAYLSINRTTNAKDAQTTQSWDVSGRLNSGTIFPIFGKSLPISGSPSAIPIRLYINNKTNGMVHIAKDLSTWLKITEIGK